MKKKFSALFAFLVLIVQIFSTALPQKLVYAENSGSQSTDIYKATARESTAKYEYGGKTYSLMDVLYTEYPDHPEWKRHVYCMNYNREYPTPQDKIDYSGNKYFIEEDPLEEFNSVASAFEKPRQNQYSALQGVRNALYRGFPHDADNIRETYQLTDDEFWHITQMAIHFFTDTQYNQHGNPFTMFNTYEYGMYNEARIAAGKPDLAPAYDHLIAQGGTQAPADMQLLRFISEDKNYQDLISIDFQERQIQLKKVNQDNQPLSGVKFKIERLDKVTPRMISQIQHYDEYEFETGVDGTITNVTKGETLDGKSLQMIYGKYRLTEINPPQGYEGLRQPIEFEIQHDQDIIMDTDTHPDKDKISLNIIKGKSAEQYLEHVTGAEITVQNIKNGFPLQFKKTDENGTLLNDVQFTILKGNETVATFSSTDQGFVTVNLPEGQYVLRETNSPQGYLGMPDVTFSVDASGKISFIGQDYQKYIQLDNNKVQVTVKNYSIKDQHSAIISTQVEADGKKSTKDSPLVLTADSPVSFTDHMTYENLVVGETYTAVSFLYEEHPDGKIVNPAQDMSKMDMSKVKSIEFTVTDKKGTVDIPFNNINLDPGVKYVVMSTITSNNQLPFENGWQNHVINHHNPDDSLQTFYTVLPINSQLSTKVAVDGTSSTPESSVVVKMTGESKKVHVKDVLTYKNLIAGETYNVLAYIYEKHDNGTIVDPSKTFQFNKQVSFVADKDGGTVDIDFGEITVKPNVTYIIMEKVISQNSHILETGYGPHSLSHEKDNDKAQTFRVEKVESQRLSIEKKVSGIGGDKERDFDFSLTINTGEYLKPGNTLSAKHYKADGTTTSENITVGNPYSFTLKHGERLEIVGLYENDTYILRENDYSSEGYQTSVTVNGGEKKDATENPNYRIVNGDNHVLFTNKNTTIVPTGVMLTVMPYIVGILTVGLIGIAIVLKKKLS